MGKLFNKLARYALRKLVSNELAQEQSTGIVAKETFDITDCAILRQAAAESCVLLKNDGVLPLKQTDVVSVFGRVQVNYFYVGYGSGGDVIAPYKINLIDGLKNNKQININEKLEQIYRSWCTDKKNVPDEGFWGHWPRNFDEMPLKDDVVAEASKQSDVAIVVIGRAAGEDRENTLTKGCYYLNKGEIKMLDVVTKHFKKVVVVLNSGNIMDMSWVEKYGDKLSGVLIAWQGGQESGNAVADVLSGKVSCCGKLSSTIARNYNDYPSAKDFGNRKSNNYVEDIYVGYRYFETFAQDKVLYPFGFGLSYTKFSYVCDSATCLGNDITLNMTVANKGNAPSKAIVQVYVSAPQGVLGKATKVLVDFAKTDIIDIGAEEKINISFNLSQVASYDDCGKTANEFCWLLEKGIYNVYVGEDVRNCELVYSKELSCDIVVEQLSQVMAVEKSNVFDRFVAKQVDGRVELAKEATPYTKVDLASKILSQLPKGIEQTGDNGFKLSDVANGTITMEQFVAQLSNEELEAISRGEGKMQSKLGIIGNAGAFGGVTQSLRDKGIAPIIATDGPAGIRIKKPCSLIACGTALACSWNKQLITQLFEVIGEEMLYYGSDVMLSPGMNIHRNVLCGRNFEYFSEDPVLSGLMAVCAVNGLQSKGVSACPKHFACNNQEVNRNYNDSRVSERALREIYLKGFEICVKQAKPLNIMTSYNKINGVWSHYNYELATTVLRSEWGYKGNIVTDWWMRSSASKEFPNLRDNAYRVRAQVDVLMPGEKMFDKKGENSLTLLETFNQPNGITLGELQRTAINVLNTNIKLNKIG